MGSLALQDIKGVIRMVLNRSFLCSSAREAMTAGTEQPNPTSRGRKARPDRPKRLMMSSMTKATRAM